MVAEALPHSIYSGRVVTRDRVTAAVAIAPAILYIVALLGVPVVLAVYYSFSNVSTGSTGAAFVGFRNFIQLAGDANFRTAVFNTFVLTCITLLVTLVLATILAELLQRPVRGKWVVRFLILLPWTAPVSLSVIGWLWMFDSVFSPIDWTLRQIGLLGSPGALLGATSNLYWLGTSGLAMASIILVSVWRILPLAAVIILAGLNSIPRDVQEQSLIDGAGYFRRLFRIVIPMLFPILMVAVLFTFVFTFTDMVVVYILTRGGPANSTQVLTTLSFFTGIQGGSLGQGAAIALFLFPVLAGVTAVILTLVRRREA